MRRLSVMTVMVALGGPAMSQEPGAPLSAIDWLSQSVESAPTAAASRPQAFEPPVASTGTAPGVTVSPLEDTQFGPLGVLPSEVTGLPISLWARSDESTLVSLIRAEQVETLPALQDLLVTLMLAVAEPPDGSSGNALFLTRADKLLDMGAIEAAQSLLESGDLLDREVFRRWFDVSLLRGTESEACAMLKQQPTLAPTLMARVFCVARNGDWNAAALTLNTARALGDVTPDEEALLTRFLDPELAVEGEDLFPPSRPSPLVYRLKEAVGELMPTSGLPLAFAHADLRDTVAWRGQIEAAERLARHAALSENVLLSVYTARAPAASGGVWDRAAAIQDLEAALGSDDDADLAEALQVAWAAMEEAGLQVPFARVYGETLLSRTLDGTSAQLAHRIALLSPAYEAAARSIAPRSVTERIWRAVATGEFADIEPKDAPSAAVLAGFRASSPSNSLATTIEAGRIGEAVLRAIAAFQQGLDGDHHAVTDAIATLRAAGLDDVARRAALQYLILDART